MDDAAKRLSDLTRLRQVLGSGRGQTLSEFEEEARRAGDSTLVLTAHALAAAQRRQVAAVLSALDRLEKAAPLDTVLRYACVIALYFAAGLDVARPHLLALKDAPLSALPDEWCMNARHLMAAARLATSEGVQVDCDPKAEARFIERQPIPVVWASVNGGPPALFIVDTGAPTTVLSIAHASAHLVRSDLAHPKVEQDSGGHRAVLYPALVDLLEVAGVRVRGYHAHLMEFGPHMHVAGILSPVDAFRGWCVEIDFYQQALRVFPASQIERWKQSVDSPLFAEPLLWNEGSATLPVRLPSGRSAQFLVDTGAGANVLCSPLANELNLTVQTTGVLVSPTAAGSTTVRRSHPVELSVGMSGETTTASMVSDCPNTVTGLFPSVKEGYLGVPWFQGRRVAFTPDASTILFTPRLR